MRAIGLAVALMLAGCSAAPGPSGAPSSAPPAFVACYDAARDALTRTLPGECAGEVVDDRRVAEIIAERTRRTRQAVIQAPPRSARRQAGSGTGFYVDGDGAIVTDRHVVANCTAVTVSAPQGPERPVAVVALDAGHDLALLRDAGSSTSAVAGFNPQPGAALSLSLVGFPERAVEPTATPVFVAADQLADPAHYVFHGDVRHGHSGGPILDQSGRVVGIARGVVDTERTYRATGQIITEIGLAISNRAILGFLGEHGVRTSTAAMAASADRLAQAHRFLVHVRCWR